MSTSCASAHRLLAILRGVADVAHIRAGDGRKARLQGRDDPARIVHRQRRLGDVGQFLGVRDVQRGDVVHGLHQMHLAVDLPDRAGDFGMAGMADQHDLPPAGGVAAAFIVNLGDQRTGGIDDRQPARRCGFLHLARDAVGAENGARAGRHLVQLVDEDRATGAQILNHVAIVHDFVTDIDRGAVLLQRALDNFDGPLDARAKAAGLGQDDADHAASPVGDLPGYGMAVCLRQCRRVSARIHNRTGFSSAPARLPVRPVPRGAGG
jgi:hypothetical protein